MSDVGADIDARAAVAAFRAIVVQAEATLAQSVQEAPVDAPEHAEVHHGRPPGELRESAHIVYVVNEQHFNDAESAAAAIESLARTRQLYRVDAEIRYETEYARRQHDQLQLKHPHGGKSKYLEGPIQMARPQLDYRLRRVMS